MDSKLYYWGIFFLSLPIATYILTVYRTQARVAQEAKDSLQHHMFAVEKEILRLTKKNAERGQTASLAIQGFLFVVVISPAYLSGQFSEKTALTATLAWSIYVSAKAWECAQVRGCVKVLERLNSRLLESSRQVSVSLEKAAKLPPGMFDHLGSIVIDDGHAPSENESRFTLVPFSLQGSTGAP